MTRTHRWARLMFALIFVLVACGGSDPPPTDDGVDPGEPVRWWSFSEYRVGTADEQFLLAEGMQIGGALLENRVFGPVQEYNDHGVGLNPHDDGEADGQIFSDSTGATYWVWAQAPNDGSVPVTGAVVGNFTKLVQVQRFRKLTPIATFKYVVSDAFAYAFDGNNRRSLCPDGNPYCDGVLRAMVSIDVRAAAVLPDGLSTLASTFHHAAGILSLDGYTNTWEMGANTYKFASNTLWSDSDFIQDHDIARMGDGQFATIALIKPLAIDVDISSVAVGGEFDVLVSAWTSVRDGRGRESYLSAFLKDPRLTSGGVGFESTGLRSVKSEPRTIPAGLNSPGTIEFLRPVYKAEESSGAGGAEIQVLRVGGSRGEVSVTFSTTDGSAVAGADYVAQRTTLTFKDGDDAPRFIRVPLIQDSLVEGTETVLLSLSEPLGGVVLGAQSSAELQISNSVPASGSFTLGGTLSGLAGTGLVLGGPFGDLAPTANGPFTMPGTLVDGLPYTVRVLQQPANPAQVCTLTNASGVVAGANITNVQVVCSTPAPVAGLDPSFGTAGKAFNSDFENSPAAVALQSSGKIVVVGNTTLSRFNADGSLDTSFATSGHATVVFAVDSSTAAQSVTVQPDDKILVVGAARVGAKIHMAVARYLADGALDTAFGSSGLRTIDPYVQLGTASRNHVARRALVAADGKIYVAGNAGVVVGSNTLNSFAVARLNADGSLDTSYSGDGAATNDVGSRINYAYAIGIQTDGKVVLAGAASNSSLIGEAGIGLARFKTDGSIDTDNPRVPSNYGPDFAGISLIDPSFFLGTSGGASTDVDMVMLPDDNLVVTTSARVPDPTHGTVRRISLLRVGAQGVIQNGPAGIVVALPAGPGPGDDLAHALVRLRDGKFVVVGQVSPTGNLATTADFAVLRFNADLTPDLGFGAGGVLLLDFFGGIDNAVAVVEQPDGKIVVVGSARNGTRTGIGIARLQ